MTFTPRNAAQIRAEFLSALASRYAARGLTLDVSKGSDAYKRADAFALIVAPIEAQAARQVADTFIDTASPEAVARHARMYGIASRTAVAAELLVEVTGTPSTNVTPSGELSHNGALFSFVEPVVFIGDAGVAFVRVLALEPGRAGNLQPGAELIFTRGTPAGVDSTVVVASIASPGEDAEDTELVRARVLARLRQRPASGNAEDWRSWCEDCDGVERAFVYPLLEPATVAGDALGCVSVVVMGPPQGDSAADSRTIAAERCAEIREYITGARDASGAELVNGAALYPATMNADDFAVYAAGASSVNVELQVKNSGRYPFPFTGALTVTSASATQITVDGDHASKTGARALLRVGTSLVRGGWEVTELRSGAFDGVSSTTFQVALSGAPDLAGAYPAPPNWEALRLAVFALFDSLGPKDTAPARRWPAVDIEHGDTVYRSALEMAARSVRGVTNVAVTAPVSDFAPVEAKQLATLGLFLVTAMP